MFQILTQRVRTLRGTAQTRRFHVSTTTLDTADKAIDRVRQIPVVGLFWIPAERFVEWRLDAWTDPKIEDFESLNAKKTIAAVKDLDDRYALLGARYREANTKNRKTVLAAIDDRLSRLVSTPSA